MRSSNLANVKKEIEAALGELQASKKILVVDQLDALLAATGEETTSLKAQETLLQLRQVSYLPLSYKPTNTSEKPARTCNPPHALRRPNARREPAHNAGAGPREPGAVDGARGGHGAVAEDAGYGDGEGRQWCGEDHGARGEGLWWGDGVSVSCCGGWGCEGV